MKNQGDGRAGAGPGAETAFKTTFGPWKDDFGHCHLCLDDFKRRRAGAPRMAALYIGMRGFSAI